MIQMTKIQLGSYESGDTSRKKQVENINIRKSKAVNAIPNNTRRNIQIKKIQVVKYYSENTNLEITKQKIQFGNLESENTKQNMQIEQV